MLFMGNPSAAADAFTLKARGSELLDQVAGADTAHGKTLIKLEETALSAMRDLSFDSAANST